ncbi:hypothetical protein O1L60_37915 [Streptomyces diastatochromogenes]|nr:hypothetical protein [Streptomyces diastatochromogenes]
MWSASGLDPAMPFGPAAAGDALLVAHPGRVTALDPRTGDRLWSYEGGRPPAPEAPGPVLIGPDGALRASRPAPERSGGAGPAAWSTCSPSTRRPRTRSTATDTSSRYGSPTAPGAGAPAIRSAPGAARWPRRTAPASSSRRAKGPPRSSTPVPERAAGRTRRARGECGPPWAAGSPS